MSRLVCSNLAGTTEGWSGDALEGFVLLPVESVGCPYCGEPIELIIDDSVEHQTYIEDCSVCCRPINVSVDVDASGEARVAVSTDSE